MKLFLITAFFLITPLFFIANVHTQTSGIISDATILPPDYHAFSGPDRAGESYVDPVFGTVVKRMTDSGKWATNGNGGEIPNSEIAYFNANDTYFMVSEHVIRDGVDRIANVLYDGLTGQFLRIAGLEKMGPWWCRWAIANKYNKDGKYVQFDPAEHFYKYEGNEIRLYDVQDGTYVVLHRFTEYNQIGPAGGEGDLSLDGRYWLLDGDNRELFLFDLIDDIKYPASSFDLGNLGSQGSDTGVDYAAVSALGNYIIVSWSNEPAESRYRGLELYDKNWKFLRQLHPEIGHWVRGVDAFGDEVIYCAAGFGVQEFWQRQNVDPGDYVSVRLKDGFIRQLIDMPDWVRHLASAVSIAYQPNYIYVAFRDRSEDPNELWAPYWGEIVEVPTDGSQIIRRLVHHRTRKINGKSQKFYQPDFNINHAGTRIIYRSSYNHNYCDLYMFDIAPRDASISDGVPPNAPIHLSSPEQSYHSITLTWEPPAIAPDGDGASYYRIFRNDRLLEPVFKTSFIDTHLPEDQSFAYRIFAVDKAGNQSVDAAIGTFFTIADYIAPVLTSVQPLNPLKVLLYLSEPVDKTSAEEKTHYRIDPGVVIEMATLSVDEAIIELTTSPLQSGVQYDLWISGLKDQSKAGNVIDPNTRMNFHLSTGFYDNFENVSADNWLPWHPDRWQVRPDAGDRSLFLGIQKYDSPGGQRLGEYALIKSLPNVGSDFELSCLAKSAEDLQLNRYADYALVFGYQDTLSYFYVQFHSYDVLACQVSDGQRLLLKKTETSSVLDDYSNISIRLKNDSLTVYVADKMVLFTLLNNYHSGAVGIGSYNDDVFFDEVAVKFFTHRDILAPEPPRGVSLRVY